MEADPFTEADLFAAIEQSMSLDPEIVAIYEQPLSAAEFESRLVEALASVDGEEGEQLGAPRLVPPSIPHGAPCRRKTRELANAGVFARK